MSLLFAEENRKYLEKQLLCAENKIVLFSAFLKEKALRWVSSIVEKNNNNPTVTVIVRWAPQDLLTGSSDFCAYEYAKSNQWAFFINPNMHFKIYLIDNINIIVGSANLTRRGLHLGLKGNDEACIKTDATGSDIVQLDQYISTCCLVTDELYSEMKEYIDDNNIEQDLLKTQPWPEEIHKRIAPSLNQLWVKDLLFNSPLTINRKQCDFIEQDLLLLGLSNVEDLLNKELTLSALRSTIAWRWLIKTVKDSEEEFVRFGELSAKLHRILVDDPKPYQRDVKTFLANLYEWVRYLDPPELGLKKFNKTEAIFLKDSPGE